MKPLKELPGYALEFISRFLKHKKAVYMIPLFFIFLAVVIVTASYFLFQTAMMASSAEEEEHQPVSMNFDAASQLAFNGETVVIDPGHGGRDPGAPSVSGRTESEIVYDIAVKTADILEAAGAEVELTRGSDDSVSLDERQAEGDVFISLHSDAMNDPSITGFTTFYTYDDQKDFAESMNAALDEYSMFRNRGTHQSNYQVTWQLDYPAVLVELGFLSNEIDDRMLSQDSYQDLMARAIAEGTHDYLN